MPKSAPLAQPPPILRRGQLRVELLATVDSLHRRRTDLVSEGFIADYVALHWLEWERRSLAAHSDRRERLRADASRNELIERFTRRVATTLTP